MMLEIAAALMSLMLYEAPTNMVSGGQLENFAHERVGKTDSSCPALQDSYHPLTPYLVYPPYRVPF